MHYHRGQRHNDPQPGVFVRGSGFDRKLRWRPRWRQWRRRAAGILPGTRSTLLAVDPTHPGTVAIDLDSLVLDNAGVATLL